jgi:5-deoxy-D-glucuronate isomerase
LRGTSEVWQVSIPTARSLTGVVRDEDVVLVPRGFHGPAAAPGHHVYYLNVMAGPSPKRVWKFCDDPVHA